MKIHKEGWPVLLTVFIILMVLFLIIIVVTAYSPLCKTILGISEIVLFFFTILFFRNPTRKIKADDYLVFAPADGKIIDIEEVYEKEFLQPKCLKISTFMSIYNIHVNRYPVSGKITYTKYHPGKYLVARHPKSSELNEHHSTGIETPDGTSILLKQIAGTVARRIICYASVGGQVNQGDDIGFIRFGSRVDLFLPLNTEICVKLNERVKGNQTLIARL